MKEYEYVRDGGGQGLDDEEASALQSLKQAPNIDIAAEQLCPSTPTKSVRNSYWELPHGEVLTLG